MINKFPISNFHFPLNFQFFNSRIRKLVTNWRLETGDWRFSQGFTLIELLVVISIIGILIGLSIFGLQGARKSSRDSKRKADMELIRSGIEIYKSDCNKYPVSNSPGNPTTVLATIGSTLAGDDVSSSSCLKANVYISQIPADPISPNADYLYWSNGTTYQICTSLEGLSGGGAVTCGGSSSCGNSTCNYQVVNP